MSPLAVLAAVAVFVVVLVRAADWSAARVLWIGLVLLALGALAVWLYHRRRLAEVLGLEAEHLGGWRRVHKYQAWPKECRYCGMAAHTIRATRVHREGESACAGHLARLEAAERAAEAAPPWSATVTGRGQGAVDTMAEPALDDAGTPALEA